MTYIIAYGKFVDDKDLGVMLSGVYFGGICESEEEADEVACKCVSETQGGMVVTKIIPFNSDLRTAIKEIESHFDKMADQMYDNEDILNI